MGGGGSAPTYEVNQCDVMEDRLRQEYGNDFLTNREKFPITSQALGYLASTPCKDHFEYSKLVREYCGDVKNFTEQVGGGQICADKTDTAMRSKWCLLEKDRFKTDGKCTKEKLGNQYDSTASTYCKNNPKDKWCACYNLKNKVCFTNATAAGCGYYKQLDENKEYFKDGYDILKDNAHCRPRVCESGYIPPNVANDCKPSYKFCEKDMNIRSMTNNDIIIDCNGQGVLVLPDWWDEEFDESFFDEDREPPFDKFPLNKLPITRIPKRFRWKDKNVRYLTYSGVTSISSCCLCIIVLLSLSATPKRSYY